MKNSVPIGVIFDMDGVLIDSADLHYQSWTQLAMELGKHVTQDQFEATFGRHNNDIIPMVFNVTSLEETQQLADRKEDIYRNSIHHDTPIVHGAVNLIQALHKAGVSLAIGSSAPLANIELVLSIMKVDHLFTAMVSADEVTRGKPDPQVFSLACQNLNLKPNQCVVIEDAPAGIEAARAADTKCVAVLMHHPRSAFTQADVIVEKLDELSVEKLTGLITV